jgi:hypothetical protein
MAAVAPTSEAGTERMWLSGADWWHRHQAMFLNSRSIDDLADGFRERVQRFLEVLVKGGVEVEVSSTRRSRARAHLMHYAWRIAREGFAASGVPTIEGVVIGWDHGDVARSAAAAEEMVGLFNMAHRASLTSRHIQGRAIDMTMSWRGDLTLGPLPDATTRIISSEPRTGDNLELHDVGALYRVYKLLDDPPHWSDDGR